MKPTTISRFPEAQGGAQTSGWGHEAHAGEGAGQHRAKRDASEGPAEQKHTRIRCKHRGQVADQGQEQRGRQHPPTAEAIAEKAHHQNRCGLGQGRDTRPQRQGGAMHLQGIAGFHQGDVGDAGVDQLQAREHAQIGHGERRDPEVRGTGGSQQAAAVE